MKISQGKKLLTLGVALVLIDQIIKVLVKTNMYLGETIDVLGDWFKLHFVLNEGMAFGMAFGGFWGKALLSIFRVVLFGALCWWIRDLLKRKNAQQAGSVPTGVLVGLTMIAAGAMGNIIDSFFYGLIWPEITMPGAPFPFMFGRVVDMFYFPLFEYQFPWMKQPQIFFSAIFNFADSCVTCGALYLLFFQWKFFAQESKEDQK